MAVDDCSLEELSTRVLSRPEWLIVRDRGSASYARAEEIRFGRRPEGPTVSCVLDSGAVEFLLAARSIEGDVVSMEVCNLRDGTVELLELVPRTGYAELRADAEAARLARANAIGEALVAEAGRSRVRRVEMSSEDGRSAWITIESFSGARYPVLADVSDSLTPEFLLANAVTRLERSGTRKVGGHSRAGVAAARRQAKQLQGLRAVLAREWCESIDVHEIIEEPDSGDLRSSELAGVSMQSLWASVSETSAEPVSDRFSPTALSIREADPHAIDIVAGRSGETLRYHGLPFARVRKLAGREAVWCGIGRLEATDEPDLVIAELISELGERRRADADDRRHEYFRLASEAWLESILRRDICLLDANLFVSPVHHQFRAERDRIDLLALRSDGRLVIVEVKTSPDREMVFQAADYWRKIEGHRRRGNLARMRLFGDRATADRPALVYLVAPTLSFHSDTDRFAAMLDPQIPVCRFELNENWREGVKVFRRRVYRDP